MLQPFIIVALLAAAYQAGDRDTLAHIAANASVSTLTKSMVAKDRAKRLDAIAGAHATADAWVMLAPLADLAKSRDRRVASMAARAAVRIASDLVPEDVADREIPVDMLRERVAAWRAIADTPGRWADVRVHALDVTANLHRALADASVPFDVDRAVSDREPEVRRAALELLPIPLPDAHVARVAAVVTGDDDPDVALAAAQALCAGIALGADPTPLRAALGDAGLARVRELTATGDLSDVAATDAERCLP